jgi:hypothetical protein
MPSLSEYTNVYNSALVTLEKKGYQVWFDEEMDAYWAEKDGWDFAAWDPCGLLGLVAMFEFKKPERYDQYWWREREPELYDNLPKAPSRPYKPVYQK